MIDELLETASERSSHTLTVGEALGIAAFTGVAIGLFALGIFIGEPYPSMTLPGFGDSAQPTRDPESQPRLELVFASANEETRLSLADVFFDASPSGHVRLYLRTTSLVGTEEEWDWIERVARQNQITSCIVSVTVVETVGTETILKNRLDRTC